jgi:hypothetical protein
MLPGKDPFGELTEALVRLAPAAPPSDLERQDGLLKAATWLLPDEDSQLLLLIDQFEELFTLVEDDERQAAFMAALRTAATDRAVVCASCSRYARTSSTGRSPIPASPRFSAPAASSSFR